MSHYFTNDNNLIENIKKIYVAIKGINYYFYTDNGVFSKNELDFGTNLLLNSFDYDKNKKTLLDIGCGCGPIGFYAEKLGFKVDMIDINEKALKLCKKTKLENNISVNIYKSDAYEKVKSKYDYILSNPPIRVGNGKLFEILLNSKKYLNKNGELWIVVRKKQGADTIYKKLNEIYENIKIVSKKKGYVIIKCVNN